jgi:hypothetical protein
MSTPATVVDINQHTVTLVSWDQTNMVATYTLDSLPAIYTARIDGNNNTPPLVITAIKSAATVVLQNQANIAALTQSNPDMTIYVGTNL